MIKTNRFSSIAKYEDIYEKLNDTFNEFLEKYNGDQIKEFILQQRRTNEDGFKNSLIENYATSEELVEELKDSYLSRDYLEGEIGMIDGQEQYDGIFNMALQMIISNRVGKWYKRELEENRELNGDAIYEYRQKYKHFMNEKKDITTKLMYSLYIYKETENNNDFFYGHRKDNNGKDTFVIDLPVYGQICVHFGSEKNLESIKYIAKQSIDIILNKKLELAQITKKEFDKIKNKTNNNAIFPEYTGKLYEYSSAIPLDNYGKRFIKAQKDLNTSNKMTRDINDKNIKEISNSDKYNSRELYYFAVKSDFSKEQLEKLSKNLIRNDNFREKLERKKTRECVDLKNTGREAVRNTTAKERQLVYIHERDNPNIEEYGR